MDRTLIVYFDYKSPYTFIARDLIYDLEQELRIDVDWRPYCINIPDMFGSAEVNDRGELVADGRSDHQWRRIRYLYLDCRRVAQKRGLTLRAPLKVSRSDIALSGCSMRAGAARCAPTMISCSTASGVATSISTMRRQSRTRYNKQVSILRPLPSSSGAKDARSSPASWMKRTRSASLVSRASWLAASCTGDASICPTSAGFSRSRHDGPPHSGHRRKPKQTHPR